MKIYDDGSQLVIDGQSDIILKNPKNRAVFEVTSKLHNATFQNFIAFGGTREEQLKYVLIHSGYKKWVIKLVMFLIKKLG